MTLFVLIFRADNARGLNINKLFSKISKGSSNINNIFGPFLSYHCYTILNLFFISSSIDSDASYTCVTVTPPLRIR